MGEEKRNSPEIKVSGGVFRWLDNFWYHYKWHTIIVAFCVIVATVCILQTCSREKKDTVIVYGGPVYLSVSENEQLNSVLQSIMPYDLDGNGEKVVATSMYEIYSEDQIREIVQETDDAGHPGYVDRNRNNSQYQTYNTYIQTGASSILLLDPWLYESLGKDYLMPMSELFEELPVGTLEDGYGVRLGDTDLYREYAALQKLPADTIVCLMKPLLTSNKSRKEALYQREKDMFCAIVSFESPESESDGSAA